MNYSKKSPLFGLTFLTIKFIFKNRTLYSIEPLPNEDTYSGIQDAHGIRYLSSAVPGLIIGHRTCTKIKRIQSGVEIDYRHHLNNRLIVKSKIPHRGSVYVNSVGAPHNSGNRNGDYLLGNSVKFIGLHNDTGLSPLSFKEIRLMRHHLVHVGNEINAEFVHDLVVNFLDLAIGFGFIYEFYG